LIFDKDRILFLIFY